jgi:hypothetical protein
MPNPHRGEARIKIGRKTYTVAYDWNAIAALKEELGSEFDQKISEAAVECDLRVLASVLRIGLVKHHGDALSDQDIIDASPPVVQVNTAIQTALTRAFHGTDEPPEEGGEENPPNGPLTWLRRLFGRRARRA